MARSGFFRVGYDPDRSTPLPRPFQLEGEGKNRKPEYPRGSKPPESPNIPTAEQANPRKGDVYDTDWTRHPPHKTLEQGSKALDIRYVSLAKAREMWGADAKAGYYYLVQTGTVNVMGVQVPQYKWLYIPNKVASGIVSGLSEPYYNENPKALLGALRWLWRHGMEKEYFALWRFAKRRALERAGEATDEWRKWAAEYEAWRRQQYEDWRKYTDWWRT